MRGPTLTFVSSSIFTTTLVAIVLGSLVSGCGGGGGGGGASPAASERFLFIADAEEADRFELYAADPRGGMPTKISGELVEGGDVRRDDDETKAPQMSPDGALVAYRADQEINGQVELFLTSSYFPNSFRISADDVQDVQEFGFSPDGKYLHYVATGRDYGLEHLHVVPVSGNEDSSRLSPHLGPGQAFADIRWSPDGTEIAYAIRWEEETAVFLDSMTDPGRVRISKPAYGDKVMDDIRWSPDGSRLAYAYYDYASGEATLFISDSEGSHLIVADESDEASDSSFTYSCQWSPDGEQLLVTENSVSDVPTLNLVSLDGTEVSTEEVDAAHSFDSVGWSRTGSEFSYVARHVSPTSSVLNIVSTDDGERQKILHVETYQRSPDGDRFFVTFKHMWARKLVVHDETGAPLYARVTVVPGSVSWSPDGVNVAYRTLSRTGETKLRTWDSSTLLSTTIADAPAGSTLSRYEWARSGSRLLYWTGEDGSDQQVYSCTATGGYSVVLSDLVGMEVVMGPRD